MVRAKSAMAAFALTAAAVLATVGVSSSAFAAPGHDGSSQVSGTKTVRTRDGATNVVSTKSTGARDNLTALSTGPSYHGCPYGAVCIYPANTGWNGDRPKYAFYSYAGHNISNEYGTHRVADNQYGAHSVGECAGYNGTGGLANVYGVIADGAPRYAPVYWDGNLTPVNSFDLRPYSEYDSLCYR